MYSPCLCLLWSVSVLVVETPQRVREEKARKKAPRVPAAHTRIAQWSTAIRMQFGGYADDFLASQSFCSYFVWKFDIYGAVRV